MIIRVRRGLEANRLSYTPQSGEPTFTTDEKKLYIGDGVTPGGILVDMSGSGVVQTIVAGTNITVDNTDPSNPIVSSSGGGGGGAVDSVNGQTGTVVLDQDDIGDGTTYKQYSATDKSKLAGIETAADVTDATNVGATGAFMKSVDDTDDITQGTNKFATAVEKTKLGHISVTQAVNLDTVESDLASHIANTSNPHSTTKSQVGLGNADNTSDVNKPVSTATQTALDAKVTGAASSTDNAVARFDLTSGKILQDSKLTVDDEGKIQYNTSGLTTAAALTSIISSSSTNNLGYANGVLRLIDNSMTINATSSQIVGRYFAVDTTGSVVKNDPSVTGWLPITYLFNSGGTYRADTNATSALAIRDMVGASNFDRINGGTLTVSEYSSFLSQGSVGAGVTITTLRGMWVTNLPTVSGTITNQIGIDIDAITKATTLAVGLRIGQPTTATTNRALQLTGTGTTVAGGIQFGGTSDTTNIYRSAAGTLKTDGSLAIAPSGKTALALTNTGANTGITLGGDTNLYRSAADVLATDDDLSLKTAGKGLQIKEGSNAKMGVATLVAGTVTVANTSVTANSRIFLTVQSLGTILLPAAVAVTARTASTSFTITSADVTDTSVVVWHIIEPSA